MQRHAAGGKKGIRTLERVLAVTRFPIVRLRPAQPSFHIFNFYIIPQLKQIVKRFLQKNSKISKAGRLSRQTAKCSFTIDLISACSGSAGCSDSAGSADCSDSAGSDCSD